MTKPVPLAMSAQEARDLVTSQAKEIDKLRAALEYEYRRAEDRHDWSAVARISEALKG